MYEIHYMSDGPLIAVGDIHGRTDKLYLLCKQFTNCNFMLLGDLGFGFIKDLKSHFAEIAEETNNRIYMIDGNHDKHSILWDMVGDRHVRRVAKIRPNVFYCDRGSVINHEGKNWLCFGGAVSVDRGEGDGGWWVTERFTADDMMAVDVLVKANVPLHGAFLHGCPWDALPTCLPSWKTVPFFSTPELIALAHEESKELQVIVDTTGVDRVVHGHMHTNYYWYDRYKDISYEGVANLDGGNGEGFMPVIEL